LRPTFPRARHIVQDAEWKDATDNQPELRGAYSVEELEVLAEAGLIQLVDGRSVIAEGIVVEPTGGHTRGHQIVLLGDANDRAIYISELCPSTAHLRVFWTMSYDQDLLEVRRAKMRLLTQASTERQLVLFNHDPNVAAARVQPKSNIEFAIAETVSL
jgi:glyoxylase-like metal-dependent hydrolase (beta-lactamase superfamily II)